MIRVKKGLSQNTKIQQDMVSGRLVSINILYEKFILRQPLNYFKMNESLNLQIRSAKCKRLGVNIASNQTCI